MGWILFFIAVAIYFIPSDAAYRRKHNNFKAILVLNIFLGWTFLGWVLALIWAYTDNIKKEEPKLGRWVDYSV